MQLLLLTLDLHPDRYSVCALTASAIYHAISIAKGTFSVALALWTGFSPQGSSV